MHTGNPPLAPRRSSRVSTTLPILVTTLAGAQFSEVCKTLVVNAHGCAILTPMKFDAGVPLRLHHKDGRETTARVVSCLPADSENRSWRLGAKLDRPENFWGLTQFPEDWVISNVSTSGAPVEAPVPPNKLSVRLAPTPEATLDLVAQRLETPLRRMIAEALGPLQAEVAAVKETVARREANPSRFEVSLSSIPPQLEQQLESRLQKDLKPKLLEDSRNQYTELLHSAKTTIDRQMNQSCDEFTRRASEELKTVARHAQELSAKMTVTTQDSLRQGLEDFRRKLLDGGNDLKRLSEELIEYLRQSATDEHSATKAELEKIRASVAAESSRLRTEVEALDRRIAKLDESARLLESGLDKRLGQMASNTLSDMRGQLESVTQSLLEELTAESVKIVEARLASVSQDICAAQEGALASVTESLDSQRENALHLFENSMTEMANRSVEQWRLKLAARFEAIAKSVGEQFQSEGTKH
jgi:DNA polymerase III psi subunit